jgi:hypothetical protein
MVRTKYPVPAAKLVLCLAAGLVSAGLAGCTFGPKKAEAQTEKIIETFSITANTLVIVADTQPTLDVQDGTTIYTLQSQANVNFTGSTGTRPTGPVGFTLAAGDVIIERPGIGSLTLLRPQ